MKPAFIIAFALVSLTICFYSNVISAPKYSCQKILHDTVPLQKNNMGNLSEDEASYPGGEKAWVKYVTASVTDHIDELSKHSRAGTYTANVRFIVMEDGNISNIEVMDSNNKRLSKVAVDAIKESIRWHPAYQHGKPVKAYRQQPFTFSVVDEKS